MLWALEQLDFYHRQLVTDYYLNGLKFGEIKEKYGISLNYVSRDIKYGLKLIRKKCKHFIK
jgi:DNA-directed RNA polymerase specialized sigma subunit